MSSDLFFFFFIVAIWIADGPLGICKMFVGWIPEISQVMMRLQSFNCVICAEQEEAKEEVNQRKRRKKSGVQSGQAIKREGRGELSLWGRRCFEKVVRPRERGSEGAGGGSLVHVGSQFCLRTL